MEFHYHTLGQIIQIDFIWILSNGDFICSEDFTTRLGEFNEESRVAAGLTRWRIWRIVGGPGAAGGFPGYSHRKFRVTSMGGLKGKSTDTVTMVIPGKHVRFSRRLSRKPIQWSYMSWFKLQDRSKSKTRNIVFKKGGESKRKLMTRNYGLCLYMQIEQYSI